ncbi:MAG: hypothetical protein WA691_05950 [Thermoplasmata archaeon]
MVGPLPVPIIKDGAATLEQGLDLARRGDHSRASEKFIDATRKFSREGNLLYANVATAYTNLLSSAVRNSDPSSLMALFSLLQNIPGTIELKLGARGTSSSELANELQLTARYASLTAMARSQSGNPESLAQGLQSLADEYRQLGNKVLYLPELLEHRAIPADFQAPILMALSFEVLGKSLEGTDPMTAAEHFQTAQQYWAQAGYDDNAQSAAIKSGNLALKAKCWVCGREGTGHGVQFVSLTVDKEATGLNLHGTSPLPSMDRSGRYVYVCKGCYSAIGDLADRIAVQRVSQVEDRLMREMRAMEHRLQHASGS